MGDLVKLGEWDISERKNLSKVTFIKNIIVLYLEEAVMSFAYHFSCKYMTFEQ